MLLRNIQTVGNISGMKAEELTAIRERLGLTQAELAKELKVARNTIWRWENSERHIPEFLDLALQTIERNLLAIEK